MTKKKNCREVAMELIYRVIVEEAYSNIVLNSFLGSKDSLDYRDRDFVSRLFYGVLETKLTLDYVISSYSKVKKIQNKVRIILEMAIYELLYMNAHDYAVVNEYVNLVKVSKNRGAVGFVNAILRSFIRKNKSFELPCEEDNNIENLKILYSCSSWIVESLINDYGIESAKSFLENQLNRATVTIRVNTRKTNCSDLIFQLNREGVFVQKSPIENCLVVEQGNVLRTQAFLDGLFHIQDISSQICSLIASHFKPKSVLDVCAAPGGKTFTIAQETNADIVACDLYSKKVGLIDRNAKRLGLSKIEGVVFNAENEYGKFFDLVLCDVPCSGIGVIRRKPEIKYKKIADINDLTKVQRKIIQSASKSVKSGGYLIYSTCTLRKVENENIVSDFLSNNGNFEICPIPEFINQYFLNSDEYLTMINGTLECDGFFVSVLRRIDKVD